MARAKIDPERLKARRGDPLVMLARMRVPLDQPLPPERNDTVTTTAGGEESRENYKWKDFVDILKNARGCDYVACSRIAENPEIVLFVIVWWDQDCLDEFRASPGYAIFLVSLGILDIPEPKAGGASSSSSSFRTIQTIKFLRLNASIGLYLRGWLSFFTITLAHPVTDAQREAFRRLQGPRFPNHQDDDMNTMEKLANTPQATKFPGFQHGWVQELRETTGDKGEKVGTIVQDGVFYKMWLSKEAEEKAKGATPGVELVWDDDLRGIGAIEVKEEHVDLVPIARGRSHKSQ